MVVRDSRAEPDVHLLLGSADIVRQTRVVHDVALVWIYRALSTVDTNFPQIY